MPHFHHFRGAGCGKSVFEKRLRWVIRWRGEIRLREKCLRKASSLGNLGGGGNSAAGKASSPDHINVSSKRYSVAPAKVLHAMPAQCKSIQMAHYHRKKIFRWHRAILSSNLKAVPASRRREASSASTWCSNATDPIPPGMLKLKFSQNACGPKTNETWSKSKPKHSDHHPHSAKKRFSGWRCLWLDLLVCWSLITRRCSTSRAASTSSTWNFDGYSLSTRFSNRKLRLQRDLLLVQPWCYIFKAKGPISQA